MSLTERLAQETNERKALAERLGKMTRELEEARRAALDGRGMEAELARQMEERLEREKEKRIEHAKEMAIRRIGKQDLAKGWTAWVEPYLEAKRIERALKAAGARMLKPKLMAGFSHWKGGWEDAKHAKATMSLEQRLGAQVRSMALRSQHGAPLTATF